MRACLSLSLFSFCLLFSLTPISMSAQQLSLGVIGGGAATDGFSHITYPGYVPPGASDPVSPGFTYYSRRKDYLAGAIAEWRFSPRLSLEANGIFRQLAGEWAAVRPDGSLSSISPHPVVTWQFPVLAKYRFTDARFGPFLAAGPSFRTAGNLNSADPSHVGFTLGAGVEIPWRRFAIAPTIRYTRWATDPDRGDGARTAPNQVELMLAFTGTPAVNTKPLGNRFRLGAILGTNLTGDFPTVRSSTTFGNETIDFLNKSGDRAFIVGANVEMQLTGPWSVEANAIHRPLPYYWESRSSQQSRVISFSDEFVTWVFPVMAKYRFRRDGWRPFLTLGPSFRRTQSLGDSSPYGIVGGGGVALPLWRMEVAPAVRFTRWGGGNPTFGPEDRRNQAELLVGVTL